MRNFGAHLSDTGVISLTPGFSGVIGQQTTIKTVLTVFRCSQPVTPRGLLTKTVKTVLGLRPSETTPLKRGVNERLAVSSFRGVRGGTRRQFSSYHSPSERLIL